MSTEVAQQQRRYWLITSPRTASNMLVRILNLNEQGVNPARDGGYFFMPAMIPRYKNLEKPMDQWSYKEATEMIAANQACFDRLQDYLSDAEKGSAPVFVKEHCGFLIDPWHQAEFQYGSESQVGKSKPLTMKGNPLAGRSKGNKTLMPDEFLLSWSPTFLIRHPAMMIPSTLRAAISQSKINIEGFTRAKAEPSDYEVTLKWNRDLYEFYAAHLPEDSQWPLVLDADDVMKFPEVVKKYAGLAGLDPEKVIFNWEKTDDSHRSAIERRMLDSINASTGVDPSKMAGDIDVEAESVKWIEEFGEEVGTKLTNWVKDAMPDYLYLHSKRLTL